jgi:large subunit ribosomal protein L3
MTMVEGLIGKKIGMTQVFDEKGNVVPVTVIKAGPCTVIQKKTDEKDGYSAVQLGFVEDRELKKSKKPVLGHFKKADVPPLRFLREFRFNDSDDIKEGMQLSVEMFEIGEKLHVIGSSKGKGFAGVIKRWGFHGGKKSHGSMFHRRPGSVGASAYPSRVVKGKKLPGHMGHERVTVKNLTVVQTDKEKHLLLLKGAVPGANGGYILLKKAGFALNPSKGKE